MGVGVCVCACVSVLLSQFILVFFLSLWARVSSLLASLWMSAWVLYHFLPLRTFFLSNTFRSTGCPEERRIKFSAAVRSNYCYRIAIARPLAHFPVDVLFFFFLSARACSSFRAARFLRHKSIVVEKIVFFFRLIFFFFPFFLNLSCRERQFPENFRTAMWTKNWFIRWCMLCSKAMMIDKNRLIYWFLIIPEY